MKKTEQQDEIQITLTHLKELLKEEIDYDFLKEVILELLQVRSIVMRNLLEDD